MFPSSLACKRGFDSPILLLHFVSVSPSIDIIGPLREQSYIDTNRIHREIDVIIIIIFEKDEGKVSSVGKYGVEEIGVG